MKKDKRDEQINQHKAGFTLIEVLLVVAILGILAGIVVVNLSGRQEKAMIRAARASIGAISTAIDLYEVDTGRFPGSLNALTNDDGAPNWSVPYLKSAAVDPWGQQFNYSSSGNGYKVSSGGPDMSHGGADDISSF